MFQNEYNKIENQEDSALSTCQRDYQHDNIIQSDNPIRISIQNKIQKIDNKQAIKGDNQINCQNNSPNINIEGYIIQNSNLFNSSLCNNHKNNIGKTIYDNDYENINNNCNQDIIQNDNLSSNCADYQKAIKSYVNSINNIFINDQQSPSNNFHKGQDSMRKQICQDKRKDNKNVEYSSQISNFSNINQNKLKQHNQINSNQIQQLDIQLQQQIQKNTDKQKDVFQSHLSRSLCQRSEYVEREERLDENYSYYEVVSIPEGIQQQIKETSYDQDLASTINKTCIVKNQNKQLRVKEIEDNIKKSEFIILENKINTSQENIKPIKKKISIDNKSSLQQNKLNTSNDVQSYPNEEGGVGVTIHDKSCKICLEGENTPEAGELLSPCKCNGSMQFIHEECLKTWLVTQKIDIDTAACELCKMQYNMEITIGKKFQLNYACNEGQISFISCLCLLVLAIGMFSIIFLFAFKWEVINSSDSSSNSEDKKNKNNKENENESKDNSFSYKLSILIACIIICLVILILLILSINEAFFVDYMQGWRIYNQNKGAPGKEKKIHNHKQRANINQQANEIIQRGGFQIQSSIINNSIIHSNVQQIIIRNNQQLQLRPNNQAQSLSQQQYQQEQNQNYSIQSNKVLDQSNNNERGKSQLQDNNRSLNQSAFINKLIIGEQSLNESYLNSSVLQFQDQQSIFIQNQQYNLEDKELEIVMNLVNNQDDKYQTILRDDYCLNQTLNNTIQVKPQPQSFNNHNSRSLRIISSKSKSKLQQNNLIKIPSQNIFSINNKNNNNNNNNNNMKGTTSMQKCEIRGENEEQIQNEQIKIDQIQQDDIKKEYSQSIGNVQIDIEKINKILSQIPEQFKNIDNNNEIIYNVLITKEVQN